MRLLPLLLLLLAACAAQPRAVPPSPPLSYPPSVRDRIQAVLEGEWREWGSVVRDVGAPAPAESLEAIPDNFPRVLAYWRAVPDDEGAIARNRGLYAAALAGQAQGARLWHNPAWSAAFISYVMLRAGVDTREFRPSAAHAFYLDHAVALAAQFPAQAPFLPRRVAEYAPRPGDLVCADRSEAPITDWSQRARDEGRFRPMHCDIVARIGPGVVEAIGGNVADAVTRTRFRTDARGLLLPNPPGSPVWFGILENRLGRLPPWSPVS